MKQRLTISLLFLAVTSNLMVLSSAKAVSNSSLTVMVNGLKNQRGQVCLTLFATGRGFPSNRDRAVRASCIKAANAPLAVTFPNLKAGSYAVAVFHDANNDGNLNSNGLGIPTERFGFSQNPVIRTGPPKFGDAAVIVAGTETNIQIQLQSLFGQ